MLLVDSDSQTLLVDLGSKLGLKLNNSPISPHSPVTLKSNDEIQFGFSTRKYKLKLGYERVERLI